MHRRRPLLPVVALILLFALARLLSGCTGRNAAVPAAQGRPASETPVAPPGEADPASSPAGIQPVPGPAAPQVWIPALLAYPTATQAPPATPALQAAAPGQAASGRPAGCPDPASVSRPMAPRESVQVPILMYHHLQWLKPGASALLRSLTVTPTAFEQQMAYLASHGYHTVPLADLAAYFEQGVPLPENPVVITFDDGWRDDYTVAFPVLRKYCLTGTFFPITSVVDSNRLNLTWAQIGEMSRAGMEFGSHTVTHATLTLLSEKRALAELVDSRAALEQHLGLPITVLAYPGGNYNARVAEWASTAGYHAAVIVNPGTVHSRGQLLTLRRMTVSYDMGVTSFARSLSYSPPGTPTPGPAARVPVTATPMGAAQDR